MNKIKEVSDKISAKYPRLKTMIGVILVLLGFIAFITPLTPGSWLALIGLEILGVRMLIYEQFRKITKQ